MWSETIFYVTSIFITSVNKTLCCEPEAHLSLQIANDSDTR